MVLDKGVIHQILATTCGLSIGFMRGMIIGWAAPTLDKLKKGENGLSANNNEISGIASSYFYGRILGPLLMMIILDRIGRKFSIMIGCFSIFTFWLLMIFVRSVILIIILRVLMGVVQSMLDAVIFIYLAENCSPKVRGIMGSCFLPSGNVGIVVESVLTFYSSYSTAATVNAIICFCLSLTTLFMRETPYFLVMKGRHELAKKNLLWLRGRSSSDEETTEELEKIQQNMQSEMLKKRSLVTTLKSSENYRPVVMLIILFCLQLATGAAVIGVYSTTMIFRQSSVFNQKEFTILMTVLDLLTSLFFPFVVEVFSRRALLMSFSLIVAISNMCTFIFFSMESTIWTEWLPWMIFMTVSLVYMVGDWALCTLGIMRGELLPMSVKGIGISLNMVINSICAGIITTIFLPIAQTFGIQFNFLLFCISSIALFIYIFKMLPETKGKTLVDIQLSLRNNLYK